MCSLISSIKSLLIVPALAVLVLLGGCGGGVHLEGPGFEALGITGNKNRGDKKVPDRAPLLIPPDRARLPEPQQSIAAAPPQNWPKDPGDTAKAEEAEADRKQRDYEDKGDWSKKAGIDEFDKLMDEGSRKKGFLDAKKKKPLSDEYREITGEKEYEDNSKRNE